MSVEISRELSKLRRLRRASFMNGIKFYFDAVIMLAHRSYTAASFLVIHSQEELAKFHIFDHWCYELEAGQISVEEIERRFKKQVYDHVGKQSHFQMVHGNRFDFERLLDDPKRLQDTRNNALYVSYVNKKLIIPKRRTTKKIALTHINFTMIALMNMLTRAYVKQHRGSPPDDLGLDENTIMQDLCMVDQLQSDIRIGKEDEPIDENLLSYFYYNATHDNKRALENTYKLCIADENYHRLKKVRKFINF